MNRDKRGKGAPASRIMLIGADRNQIVQRRLQEAGCDIVQATGRETALNLARSQPFDGAVILWKGSLSASRK